MKRPDLNEIQTMTRKAIKEIPRSIDRIQKEYIQGITRKQTVQVNGLAIIVGIIVGYCALGFKALIGYFQNAILFGKISDELLSSSDYSGNIWMFAILPLGMLVSWALTQYGAREAKGHGVPEVIESVQIRGGKMKPKIVAIKSLASSITIASGGSVGREGPIIQIGAAAASGVGQIFQINKKMLKTIVGCGGAAAIAATFNTPIAAVIFAIEIIVLELKTKSFVPLVIASVSATIISRIHAGNEPAFFVPEYSLKGPEELVLYLVLGLLSGLVGVGLIKSLYGIEDFFDRLKIYEWAKPLVAGLFLAGVGQVFPQMYGVGYDTMTEVLQQNGELYLMVLFIGLKIVCTSVCLGAGGSGGVFVPSLFVGCMLGGSFGILADELFPQLVSSYGPYALVGMAAVFSATSRATFTAIVILFEMTLDYSVILPLMFVCVVADQTAWALSKESIYSLKLKRKGLHFVTDLSVNIMSVTAIKDIMTTELHVAFPDMRLDDAYNKLMKHNHSLYPVVSKTGEILGVLPKDKFAKSYEKHPHSRVSDHLSKKFVSLDQNTLADEALSQLQKIRDPRILVKDSQNRLVGIVSPVDFVRLSSSEVE